MSDDSLVLNPFLHRRLRRLIGRVDVRHRGEAMAASVVTDVLDDRPKFEIRRWGETYHVTCPFCRHDGMSLVVSHRYGQRDGAGSRMTYAAFCRNRDCLSRPANRETFADMLYADDGLLEQARIRPGWVLRIGQPSVALPEPSTRLDRLPAGHRARRLLRRLGLEPDRVGRAYGIRYCARVEERLARERIVVPVKVREEHRGWLALVEDGRRRGSEPTTKFLSAPGMRASELVYNLDRARKYRTGVIVPTPIDVWRFGPMAMSLVGDLASERQLKSVVAAFHYESVILLADAEWQERPSTRRIVRYMTSRLRGRFAIATLPDSRRPDAPGRTFLRELVARAAASRGVPACYGRKD